MTKSPLHSTIDEKDNYRMVFSSASISVVLHILAIAALLFVPDHATSARDFSASVISVDMISLDPEPPPLIEGDPAPSEPAEPETPAEIPVVTADDVEHIYTEEPDWLPAEPETPAEAPEVKAPEAEPPSPAPNQNNQVVIENTPEEMPPLQTATEEEPKQEKVLKAKRPNPQALKPKKMVNRAISPETLQTDSIKDAITKNRDRNVRDATRPLLNNSRRIARAGVPNGRGNRGGVPGHISEIYRQQIKFHVEQNWAFPSHLANGQKKFKGTILLTILPSGHIKEVWFEQKSGHAHLDDSVYRAVMKSNPMPPLPKGYTRYTIGLRYDSSGLN